MVWSPNPTVTIGAVDFTGEALETVRIDRGRETLFQEPRAGYCVLELIDLDGQGLDFDVLDSVEVTLDDAAGQPVTVFAGNISDWSSRLYDTGFESGAARSITTVIAVSALAQLNRRNVAVTGRPQEKDGDRIAALVTEGLSATWEETGGTWATVATPTTTWATFDPDLDLDLIDQPGVFDIAALDPQDGGYNPLSQSYLTSFSGRGVLFDTRDGFVAYADADARENAATAGYLELPGDVILAQQLATRSQFADIVNRLGLSFDGGTVRVSDTPSILAFGVLATEFETNLANSANAEAWAVDYIEDHAGPVINLSGVALRLDSIASDTLRDNLLELEVGSPVNLTDLPGTLGVTQLPAFVEGMSWRIDRLRISLALNVSDAALSIGSIRWGLVSDTLRWDQVPANLAWQDARRL